MIYEEMLHPKVWELLYKLDSHTMLNLMLTVIESSELSQGNYQSAIIESMGGTQRWDEVKQKTLWSLPTLEQVIEKLK